MEELRQLSSVHLQALPSHKQHRLLAKIFFRLYANPENLSLLAELHRLQEALNLPKTEPTVEAFSKQYHYHMHFIRPTQDTPKLLPEVRRLDKKGGLPFLPIDIYLDDLRSGYNVGSIFRTTEAFRLGSIHLSPYCPPPTHKEVLKTALGATETVPTFFGTSISDLKRPLIALETTSNALPYQTFSYPDSFTLLFGNEEIGLSETLLSKADVVLEIPLYGQKNSLNVASAFAIMASHIRLSKPV